MLVFSYLTLGTLRHLAYEMTQQVSQLKCLIVKKNLLGAPIQSIMLIVVILTRQDGYLGAILSVS
jgi:hypothetical protein